MKKNIKSLRVCYLTETIYPPIIGGLDIHAYQLAEKLNTKGVEVFVITRKIDPVSKSYELVNHVLIKRISPKGHLKGKGWKAIGSIPFFLIRIFFLLIRYINRYDIIMVSGMKILSIPAALIHLIFRKKFVIKIESPIDFQGDISDESLRKMNLSRTSILLKLLRVIRNPLIKKSQYFISISSEIKRLLIEMGVEEKKILFIPNGIDVLKFSPVSYYEKIRIRKKLSLPENKTIFCFTGRLSKAKGTMLLVQVWKEILQSYDNIQLLLVGSGKDAADDCEAELREYINCNYLKEMVLLTGNVENVNEYLQASDVFVFPSDYEGFPLSMLEALACELPSIVTKVGIAVELIHNHENGVIISPKNQAELLTALEWMLENKSLWPVIGKNARKSVEKYSMDAVADKYIEMFVKLKAH